MNSCNIVQNLFVCAIMFSSKLFSLLLYMLNENIVCDWVCVCGMSTIVHNILYVNVFFLCYTTIS